MKPSGIITLTTDFGWSDFFVGSMKGVILGIHPEARIVDVSHDIPPQRIMSAGAVLADAIEAFPAGTIHVAVVDPGVGSHRRCIAARSDQSFFVGPDNGIFTEAWALQPHRQIISLDKSGYYRAKVSPTFHGRDIFAPVAAWLARGESLGQMGTPIAEAVLLEGVDPVRAGAGVVEARVAHIDRFGNLMLNMRRAWMESQGLRSPEAVIIHRHKITESAAYFSAGPSDRKGPFFYFGSAGRLEIAVRGDSAALRLGVDVGQPASIMFRD